MYKKIIEILVNEIINGGIDVSKNVIKTTIEERKHKNVYTEIYQVIVDALNHFTCNYYKNNQDKIYETAEVLIKLFKEAKGNRRERIKPCLKNVSSNVNDHSCLYFEELLYDEICKSENIELYRRIMLLLQMRDEKDINIEKGNNHKWIYMKQNITAKYIEYRNQQIEEIAKWFENGYNYLFLYGEHGIGKTILARSFAEKYFKTKTIFIKYTNSLKDTIVSLAKQLFDKDTIEQLGGNLYNAVIDEFRTNQEMAMKWLIIIDNCNSEGEDDDSRFFKEFRGDEFQEIIGTGVNILFTTTIRTSFSDYGMEVKAMNNTKLLELYKDRAGCNATDTAIKVINAVRRNTLIVTLIAGMVKADKEKGESRLQELLKKLAIDSETNKIVVEDQGGRVSGRDTIYNHLKKVFNVTGIKESKWAAMENIILISSEGWSKSGFSDLTKDVYNNEIESLINESWIYHEELGNNVQWLSVHPMICEIVFKDEKFNYLDCIDFCENLFYKVVEVKKQDMYNGIKYSETLFRIFQLLKDKKELIILQIGYLLTEIYEETFFQYDRVYGIALDVLKGIESWKPCNLSDKIKRCRMINGSAYSLLHTNTKEYDTKMNECRKAKSYLDIAKKELLGIEVGSQREENYEKRIVEALIHGNMGAYHRELALFGNNVEMNLDSALCEHQKGLNCRQELLKEYPEKSSELDGLIATSYHCIGKDYFALKDYELALENHKQAEQLRNIVSHNYKETGQRDKWIQSCNMICITIQNIENVLEDDLELYCDKFKILCNFYIENEDITNLEILLKDFNMMSEKIDMQKYDIESVVREIREWIEKHNANLDL